MPFEKEAYAQMDAVYEQAIGANPQSAPLNAGYDVVNYEQAPAKFSDLLKHLECVQARKQHALRNEELEALQSAVWTAARKVAKHAEPHAESDSSAVCRGKDIVELRLALENHDQWGLSKVNALFNHCKEALASGKSS